LAGSACPKKVHVDPLTPILPLAWNSYEKELVNLAACTFGAFKKAVHKLKRYYKHDVPAQLGQISHNPEFPYKHDYKDGDTTVYFTYESQPIGNKLIFHARTTSGKDICVKFVHTYSSDAHKHCANGGYAPHVYSCEWLPGGWLMVIMDYVDMTTHRTYAFRHEPNFPHSFPSAEKVKTEIINVVKHLHQGGWVHGDLRDANFLVRIDGKDEAPLVMLTDFDWSGKENMARYPLDINTTDVHRPKEVKGGELITKQHDMDMVKIMWEGL
jgi:serine/threonine protein kinase